MAKYYYDRYRVNSITRYYWRKYNADERIYYTEGPWSSYPTFVPPSPGNKIVRGYASYTSRSEKSVYGAYSGSGSYYNGPADKAPTNLYQVIGTAGMTLRQTNTSKVGEDEYEIRTRERTATEQTSYTRGSYISQTTGSYSYKLHDRRNSDGYWWVRGSSYTSYSRGAYVDTIMAEDGTYPNNGRVGTSYWYIKRDRAFPDFKVKVGGQLKSADDGWVKIDGELKQIEQIWTKIDGTLKEV